MRCVWVEAWDGASKMKDGLEKIAIVQPPVDRAVKGSSSWLRAVREKGEKIADNKQRLNAGKAQMASAFSDAHESEPRVVPLTKEPRAALAEQAVKEQTSVLKSPQIHHASNTEPKA